MTALNNATLANLSTLLPGPRYDRSAITTGIVHIGVGGFHRSHQAVYVDDLLNAGLGTEWGICGVGLLPGDERMRDVMAAQDCLYAVVTKHADGASEPRIIGSMVEYLFAPDDVDAVIEKMADPAVKIVSLTITEGGYSLDGEGRFDPSTPAIVADLEDGAVPRTAFALITEALARRRDRALDAFTVMSCDNIEGNGHVVAQVLTGFAELKDAELGAWVAEHVQFPNSMVDRITPATTDDDRTQLADRFGVGDGWPVVAEPFTQWVLEDRFGAGRPAFERVGVQVVDDVEPYELMKLRLLNASHQSLAYPAYLAGYRYVHEAAQDPVFVRFLLDYMRIEAVPTLRPVPGIDLDAYTRQLIERFANPGVRDTVARLCGNSSDMIPKFLLPVVRAQLETGGPIERAASAIAFWARYAQGTDENGDPIDVVDHRRDDVMAAAQRDLDEPGRFLDQPAVFAELGENPHLRKAFVEAITLVRELGVRAALERTVARADV
jgi:mannitol 2-dehydrogenase